MNAVIMPSAQRQEVLVVYDDDKTGKGIKRLFRQYQVPWQYSCAQGIDGAVARLQAVPIDAVLAGMNLSGGDGLSLLTVLRAHDIWQDIPVIMLIGQDSAALGGKALDMGATDLLHKPVSPEELFARIRVVLHLKYCQDLIRSQQNQMETLLRLRASGKGTAAAKSTSGLQQMHCQTPLPANDE